MLQGTPKQWHVVSLLCAATMPSLDRISFAEQYGNPMGG